MTMQQGPENTTVPTTPSSAAPPPATPPATPPAYEYRITKTSIFFETLYRLFVVGVQGGITAVLCQWGIFVSNTFFGNVFSHIGNAIVGGFASFLPASLAAYAGPLLLTLPFVGYATLVGAILLHAKLSNSEVLPHHAQQSMIQNAIEMISQSRLIYAFTAFVLPFSLCAAALGWGLAGVSTAVWLAGITSALGGAFWLVGIPTAENIRLYNLERSPEFREEFSRNNPRRSTPSSTPTPAPSSPGDEKELEIVSETASPLQIPEASRTLTPGFNRNRKDVLIDNRPEKPTATTETDMPRSSL